MTTKPKLYKSRKDRIIDSESVKTRIRFRFILEEQVKAGLIEVVKIINGEKQYKLTPKGQEEARRIIIAHGCDPDNPKEIEEILGIKHD